MPSENPILSVEHRNNVVVGVFHKEHIMSDEDIAQVNHAIEKVLRQDPAKNLILDFEKVLNVSSSFFGFLVRLKKHVDKTGGRLVICGLEKKVKNAPNDKFIFELFKVVKLDTFFDSSPCIEDALEKIFSQDTPL
jgi:anti-anti-sigma factor